MMNERYLAMAPCAGVRNWSGRGVGGTHFVRRRPDCVPGRLRIRRHVWRSLGRSAPNPAGEPAKIDFVDAERAAHAAVFDDGTSTPKPRDGRGEAARLALRAREILVRSQTQAIDAAKALIDTSPESTQGKYSRLGGRKLVDALKRKRAAMGDGSRNALMLSLLALAAT